MSATAFQRQRRELEKASSTKEVIEEVGADVSALSFQDLKKLCKEKGIAYDTHSKKEDLINLLKGAE